MNNAISYSHLLEKLDYDPIRGTLTWRNNNKIAGSIDNKGYNRISIDYVRYKAHRLAWFYFYKEWPKGQIDHIDGNKLNNCIFNLRDVSQIINMYNKKKPHKNNESGFLGVTLYKGKYYAKLKVGRKLLHLGTFSSGEEAQKIYFSFKENILEGMDGG